MPDRIIKSDSPIVDKEIGNCYSSTKLPNKNFIAQSYLPLINGILDTMMVQEYKATTLFPDDDDIYSYNMPTWEYFSPENVMTRDKSLALPERTIDTLPSTLKDRVNFLLGPEHPSLPLIANHGYYIEVFEVDITRGYNLASLDSYVKACSKMLTEKLFSQALRGIKEANNYVQVRNEKAIQEELNLRQTQYPGSQILLLVGKSMYEYLRHASKAKNSRYENAIFVYENSFEPWESTIITKEQITMNYSTYTSAFLSKREARRHIYIGLIHGLNMNVQVKPLRTESIILQPKKSGLEKRLLAVHEKYSE